MQSVSRAVVVPARVWSVTRCGSGVCGGVCGAVIERAVRDVCGGFGLQCLLVFCFCVES